MCSSFRLSPSAAIVGFALVGAAASPAVWAQETAKVVSIQPRMVTLPQTCRPVTVQSQNSGSSTAGMILGGVAGGLLGSQVGGGNGRTAATAAGAITGAVVGNQLGTQQAAPQQQMVCDNTPVTVQQGEIVTFSFRGRTFQYIFEP